MAYTDEQQDLLERFKALAGQQRPKPSNAKAAKLVGINEAVMSGLLNDKYPGNVDKWFEVLKSYFAVKQQAAETYESVSQEDVDYVPTSISNRVYEIIQSCQVKGGLAIACGDAGIGKTKAAKKFCQDHPYDSLYIALNPCLTSLKALLKLLAGKLGVAEKTLDELWLGVANKLRDGMIIIFDEAQHLPIKSIESLRAFSDYFADQGQTLGIVFVGNQETVRRIGGRQRADFAQIANRTKQKVICTTRQITRADIALLFPLLAKRQMDAEIDFLLGIARSAQAIRGASNLFSNAYDNENISCAGLAAMAKHMDMTL